MGIALDFISSVLCTILTALADRSRVFSVTSTLPTVILLPVSRHGLVWDLHAGHRQRRPFSKAFTLQQFPTLIPAEMSGMVCAAQGQGLTDSSIVAAARPVIAVCKRLIDLPVTLAEVIAIRSKEQCETRRTHNFLLFEMASFLTISNPRFKIRTSTAEPVARPGMAIVPPPAKHPPLHHRLTSSPPTAKPAVPS